LYTPAAILTSHDLVFFFGIVSLKAIRLNMQTLTFSITINAHTEKVWKTMLEDQNLPGMDKGIPRSFMKGTGIKVGSR